MTRLLPIFSLRVWLGVAYLSVLLLPGIILVTTGALSQDLQNQTRWDLEHQATVLAHLSAEILAKPGGEQELSAAFRSIKRSTLSGIRYVDTDGRIRASSGANDTLGNDLSNNEEVALALQGVRGVTTRPRHPTHAPIRSTSRRATIRVFVAVPVRQNQEVIGAIVLSRTPREELQTLYHMAPQLLIGAALALGITLSFGIFSSYILSRSLKDMSIGASRIAEGHFDGLTHLQHPKQSHLIEVQRAARAVDSMATRLRERLNYISEFASNVSHEFKTPLSTLKGTLELLGDDPEMAAEQRTRFLHNATESVERLERMVTGLLSLARAEEGGASTSFDLNELISAAAQRFEVPHQGAAGWVKGERAQLEVVLTNLLENARVHGGMARVEGFQTGAHTGFRVIDDGPGISEANLSQVFDRFFTTNRRGGSSGLGLALVRAILFTHGGEISVESRPHHTVFTVHLPAESR